MIRERETESVIRTGQLMKPEENACNVIVIALSSRVLSAAAANRSHVQGAAQPNIAQHNSEMGDRACDVVVFPLCGGRDTAGGKAGRRGQVLFPAGAAGNGMTLGGQRAALCGVLSGNACIPGQPIRARRFARGFPFLPPRRCVGSLRRCRGAAGAAPYVCLE